MIGSSELVRITTDGLTQAWAEAFELWQARIRAANTRRAYRQAWEQLLTFVQKPPWEISRSDVVRWVEEMRARGLSDCTRNQRVAAVSSFYTFTNSDFTLTREGREIPLYPLNPAAGKSLRAKVDPYGKAVYLSPAEVRKLLKVIDREELRGKRDFALFLGYLFTARRNTEWRTIRWSNFTHSGGRVIYTWSGKGKRDQKNELPPPVWAAVKLYLVAADRLATIQPDHYIFIAHDSPAVKTGGPLSMREVGRSLKCYAGKAGLDVESIHVHVLRHTAAMLRKEAGDDLAKISALLAHNDYSTTQIYLDHMEIKQDTSWSSIEELLGL